ncbi:MAG: hypothetical protein V1910_01975, partial [bacterium]
CTTTKKMGTNATTTFSTDLSNNGKNSGNLTAPTTFIANCSNAGTSTKRTKIVDIIANISLSASPNPVAYNSPTTLSGNVNNINYCMLTGGPFGTRIFYSDGPYSFYSGELTENTSFQLICEDNRGLEIKSEIITVNVNSEIPNNNFLRKKISIFVTEEKIPISIDRFEANPNPIFKNNSSAISWETTGADSCNVFKDSDMWSLSATSGSNVDSGQLAEDTTFKIMCKNKNNFASALKNVTVNTPTNIILDSTCTSSQNYVNKTTIWTVNPVFGTETPKNIKTKWSGTDIIESTKDGLMFNKIYVTVGKKDIRAEVSGDFEGGGSFTSICTTTTIMKLDSGTNDEI